MLAVIVTGIEARKGPALLLLAVIGFAFAYWDFQMNTKLKAAAAAAPASEGDYEDGI